MPTLYGIKNCDTVKKARRWLEDNQHTYDFHDFRGDGINAEQVKGWVHALGWEGLVNKRSTTWKSLSDSTKANLTDKTVVDLIVEQPTLIKRPLLEKGGAVHVGFKADHYASLF